MLFGHGDSHDRLSELLAGAPIDDEPVTPEEEAGAVKAREEYRRGEFVEADQIKRELG
jgi:hypothetical protein